MSASRSKRLHSPFTCSDAHCFFHLSYKDFAVADFSRLCRAQNGFQRSLRAIVRNHYLQFRFWKEIHMYSVSAGQILLPR